MKDFLERKGTLVEGRLPFINPANGEQFGSVPAASAADARCAVLQMRVLTGEWGRRSLKSRIQLLRKFYQVLFDEIETITTVISRDTGKPRQDALIELYTCMYYFDTLLRKAPQWLRREKVPTGLQMFKKAELRWKPYGVVAVISPWNYPFVLTMNPVLGALTAGNTVVVKPSEFSAAVGAGMEALFRKVPELNDCIRFLHGDAVVGSALVESGPDLVFVTGSVSTGKAILSTAAKSVTPVVCELGGKDPLIVLEDADVLAAARWGLWGAFSNSGQTCMSPERIYVVSDVYNEFLETCLQEAQKIRVGFSEEAEAPYHYGPMTTIQQLEIVERQLDDAVGKGAVVRFGGEHNGMFFQPTILTEVDSSMALLQEETFGPLLPVIRVRDKAEAVYLANQSAYGLSAAVFGENLFQAIEVAEALEVGSVNINDTMSHYGLPRLPFGGVKQSGFGRINGRDGLRTFTVPASVVYGKPKPYDIGTILRKPGKYTLAKSTMLAVLGPTLKDRIKGVLQLLRK
ncbi:MAG: aldehyde dehydrogenase family protein [Anaerolineales bacterium]|nr:aldehyde dehydrogenase family protein [Anaerolineales bacterium]